MARKKAEPQQSGGGGWITTFADLMNLLLCFFVLLFSMSTVDAEKFEAMVVSLQNSFSIMPSGGSSMGDGMLVSAGVSQLEFLDEYYQEANSSGEGEAEGQGEEEGQEAEEGQGAEGQETGESQGAEGQETGESQGADEGQGIKEEYEEAGLKESEKMADDIEAELEKQQIADQVEVEVNAQYAMLTLNGALLFDTGKSEIRNEALPLVDKLSAILQSYDSNRVYIEGHTDNLPIHNQKYDSNDILSSYRAHSVKDYVLSKTSLEPAKIRATGCGEYNPIADNSTPEGRARNRRVEIKIYNSYNSN